MELINDAQRLRNLGAYLKSQSGSWSSMSDELLVDTRTLGHSWSDSQFRDLSASIHRLNQQFMAFQGKSQDWATALDGKADRLDTYFRLVQEK